jgi:hypothetical protein
MKLQVNVLHYKSDGTASLSFTYKKRQYFAPVVLILKALKSECDKYIYDRLMDGREDDTYYAWYPSTSCLSFFFCYAASDSELVAGMQGVSGVM